MSNYKDLTDININPVKVSDYEVAWKINDTHTLLNALMKNSTLLSLSFTIKNAP